MDELPIVIFIVALDSPIWDLIIPMHSSLGSLCSMVFISLCSPNLVSSQEEEGGAQRCHEPSFFSPVPIPEKTIAIGKDFLFSNAGLLTYH